MMTDALPEPYLTISQYRRANLTDEQIAECMGLSRKKLQGLLKRWRVKRAKDPSLPKVHEPRRKGQYPRRITDQIVKLYNDGAETRYIAAHLGVPFGTVAGRIARARQKGLVGHRYKQGARTNSAVWTALRREGIVPRMGGLSPVLDGLSPEAFRTLLASVKGPGSSLTDILTNLLEKQLTKERHDDT